jgi:hypothetical protein
MKRTMIDAKNVTRKALLGTDGGWYEAYWYTGGAETDLRLLAGLVARLAIAGRTIQRRGRSVAGSLPSRSIRLGVARGSMFRSMT